MGRAWGDRAWQWDRKWRAYESCSNCNAWVYRDKTQWHCGCGHLQQLWAERVGSGPGLHGAKAPTLDKPVTLTKELADLLGALSKILPEIPEYQHLAKPVEDLIGADEEKEDPVTQAKAAQQKVRAAMRIITIVEQYVQKHERAFLQAQKAVSDSRDSLAAARQELKEAQSCHETAVEEHTRWISQRASNDPQPPTEEPQGADGELFDMDGVEDDPACEELLTSAKEAANAAKAASDAAVAAKEKQAAAKQKLDDHKAEAAKRRKVDTTGTAEQAATATPASQRSASSAGPATHGGESLSAPARRLVEVVKSDAFKKVAKAAAKGPKKG